MRIELLRFSPPEPKRTVGLAWRKTSTRKNDFIALGRLIVEAQGGAAADDIDMPPIDCVAT